MRELVAIDRQDLDDVAVYLRGNAEFKRGGRTSYPSLVGAEEIDRLADKLDRRYEVPPRGVEIKDGKAYINIPKDQKIHIAHGGHRLCDGQPCDAMDYVLTGMVGCASCMLKAALTLRDVENVLDKASARSVTVRP